MDVDTPNLLKRCSSAPLINEAASTVATSPTSNTAPRNTSFFEMFNSNVQRTRRFSTSYSPTAAPVAVTAATSSWGRRLTPRVNQLRAEECADVSNTREVAHERETHCAMQMGQSYEDLTLQASPGTANSPTRIPRFSPSLVSSPTRKYTTRRSLSPIALRGPSFSPGGGTRPSQLAKRRGDEPASPRAKRPCTDRLTPPTPSTPGTPDSDCHSLTECTFRPVSPRAQTMLDSPTDNHKSINPS